MELLRDPEFPHHQNIPTNEDTVGLQVHSNYLILYSILILYYVYGFSSGGEQSERKGDDTARTGDHVTERLGNSMAQPRPGRSISRVSTYVFIPIL